MTPQSDSGVRHYRECFFCGSSASVALPKDASGLDVNEAFSEQGREFTDHPDGEPVGVACFRCSRSKARRETALAESSR